MIADDDTLSKRVVEVVSAERDTVTIMSGVAPGERVATSPLRGADEGDKVNPTDPANVGKDSDGEPSPTVAGNVPAGERM